MPRRRRTEEQVRQLQPTVNRFAEDTSMLGFRYLHTRYKTWFRLLWALVLTFFVGLTVYQVCERIAYYFIRASSLAAQEPELVRLLSLIYDDDGNNP
ncbi:hypothetical protein COOONC_13249 [Cooperia oncophora]